MSVMISEYLYMCGVPNPHRQHEKVEEPAEVEVPVDVMVRELHVPDPTAVLQ